MKGVTELLRGREQPKGNARPMQPIQKCKSRERNKRFSTRSTRKILMHHLAITPVQSLARCTCLLNIWILALFFPNHHQFGLCPGDMLYKGLNTLIPGLNTGPVPEGLLPWEDKGSKRNIWLKFQGKSTTYFCCMRCAVSKKKNERIWLWVWFTPDYTFKSIIYNK